MADRSNFGRGDAPTGMQRVQRQAAVVFEGERIICRRIGERRHALDPREALQGSPLVQQPGSRDRSSRLLVDDHPAEVGNIAAIHQATVALMNDRARVGAGVAVNPARPGGATGSVRPSRGDPDATSGQCPE